jgi:hypothetical protein
VKVAVGVGVGVGVGVSLAVKVAVGVGEGVNVAVRLGVKVEVGVADGRAVRETNGVLVADDVGVAVAVGIPGVSVDVTVPGGRVGVAVIGSESVGDGEASAVGLAPRGVDVAEGACVGGSVGVIGPVMGSLKQATPGRAARTSHQANHQDELNPGGTRPPVGFCLPGDAMSPRVQYTRLVGPFSGRRHGLHRRSLTRHSG